MIEKLFSGEASKQVNFESLLNGIKKVCPIPVRWVKHTKAEADNRH